MREINLNRQLLGLEDLEFGTGIVEQTRAGTKVNITRINAGNLPFDETRTLFEFVQAVNIEELGNSVEAINNLNNDLDKILIVEDNLPIINNVEAIKDSIVTLDTNILVLQNINTNMSSIHTVEDNLPIINNVEAIKESIVTLDTNILALQNINTNMSSINTVEDNLPEVVSVAQNIVPNLTEILNVDTLASQVTQDKASVSSMKLAVETLYDTFDDRFLGTKTIDPILDNDGNALIDGAMYFNTSSNTMKVYDVGTTTWYSIPQIYLSVLLDVELTSITTGDILRWNGIKWVNYSLSKSDVGLNLVDNTSDLNKPISIAAQTALNLKAPLINAALVNPTINGVAQSEYSGFKNLIVNGRKLVNQSGLTTTDTAYNYDNHYKVGNNWFMFIEGLDIESGSGHILSWKGTATASYYIGTAGSLTINTQSFTAISNGGTITPTITSSQLLWIKFASDSTGSTYNKVQFERGTIATPFENRLVGLELSLVQRYYEICDMAFQGYGSVAGGAWGYRQPYRVSKKVPPIVSTLSFTQSNGIVAAPSGSSHSIIFSMSNTSVGAFSGTLTAQADARPY